MIIIIINIIVIIIINLLYITLFMSVKKSQAIYKCFQSQGNVKQNFTEHAY